MAGANRVVIDGVSYPIDDATAVNFEKQQTLTDVQKAQARSNIGAASQDDMTSVQNAVGDVPSGSNLQDEVADLKSAVTNNAISALLHAEEIENTVQSILFDESGNVQSITHARDNVAIRTDEFTFADGTITETRTLNTGESMTIVTNTNTLQTTITYTAA